MEVSVHIGMSTKDSMKHLVVEEPDEVVVVEVVEELVE